MVPYGHLETQVAPTKLADHPYLSVGHAGVAGGHLRRGHAEAPQFNGVAQSSDEELNLELEVL